MTKGEKQKVYNLICTHRPINQSIKQGGSGKNYYIQQFVVMQKKYLQRTGVSNITKFG